MIRSRAVPSLASEQPPSARPYWVSTGVKILLLHLGLLALSLGSASAQSDVSSRAGGKGQTNPAAARITEETRTLSSYPFSEPNPVPILVRDRRLYPYHSFEGYASDSRPQEWTVVTLENDYIQVFVLPEVGGKVWGAVVRETGHEFIYRNEVMKFRNIALRGPWTSGGIEFNFGVIGHTPSTATPVDYQLRENPDGSVSCFVGAMDLPSRTHWRVEIRLPRDRAYFETRVFWYNPTPLQQPYYNWMTAAAFARTDLEMSMPGKAYLQHSGQEEAWPVDEEGRYLPAYANNTFAGHKSYHVVGELNDFFGGYYRDAGYGFGHWAPHEDMPGQKLWLWALSREGGVWEDLLTDTDGQYVEFQAGRLFVQYSPGAALNPITQAGFDPMSASQWTETWFPLEGIGGLTDASRDGAMHVSIEGAGLHLGINAFGAFSDTLRVWSEGRLVSEEEVELLPLQPLKRTFPISEDRPFRVALPALGLDYESDPTNRLLSRPFSTDPDAREEIPEVTWTVFQARELLKGREYRQALDLLEAAVIEEPWNRGALLGLSELAYRAGEFHSGLERVNRVLQLDAYDPEANFLAGLHYQALSRVADARDAYGWATRSTATRSAAYAQLAKIMIQEEDWGEATRFARLALDYDRRSVSGWRALAVVGRKTGDEDQGGTALQELLEIDPLHGFVWAERFLDGREAGFEPFGGEFPAQTLLELAIDYVGLGLRDDASALLREWIGRLGPGAGPGPLTGPMDFAGNDVMILAWQAWLSGDPTLLDAELDPAFTFPFRTESLPVLEWAVANDQRWEWRYFLALNLWAVGRDSEAASLFEALGPVPDFGPFYVARAQLLSEVRGENPGPDLKRAVELEPGNRTLHIHLVRYLQEAGDWEGSLASLNAASPRFPTDFNLQLLHARALLNTGKALEATEILETARVLPSENARESHRLFEQAHILAALDALESGDVEGARRHLRRALEWPETLGQGRPYDPEERLVRFLLAKVEEATEDREAAAASYRAVLEGTGEFSTIPSSSVSADPESRLDLLFLSALKSRGESTSLEAFGRYTSDATELGRFTGRLAAALAWGSDAAEFPLLFADLEGQMILRALTTTVQPGSGEMEGTIR